MREFYLGFNELKQYKTIQDIILNINTAVYCKISYLLIVFLTIVPILTLVNIFITQGKGKIILYLSFLSMGEISSVFVIGYFLKRYYEKQLGLKHLLNEHIFLLLILGWAFLSTLVQFNSFNAWIGDLYRNEGLFTYLAYAGIYGVSVILFNEKHRRNIFYLFIGVASVLAILTILEFNGMKIPFFAPDKVGYSAIFHQFNHYGYYLLMSGMVAAGLFVIEENRKLKLFALIAYCLSVVTLIINDTFGCYLAFIAGVIFIPFVFILAKKKVRLNYFIPLILFVLITIGMNQVAGTVDQNMTVLSNDINKIVTQDATSRSAGTGRWVLWINAIEFIKEKPLFGHGLDNLGYLYYPLGVGTDRPHNEYLQHAAHLGIPALIFYLCALASIFIRAFKNRATLSSTTLVALCTVGAYLVSALFGNTMYYTTPYFLILLGMSTKIGEKTLLKENEELDTIQ